MNFNEIDFCPTMGKFNTKVVSALLADGLFAGGEKAQGLLAARYEQMKKICGKVPHDDSRWNLDGVKADKKDKAALLPVPKDRIGDCGTLVNQLWEHLNFGHDMPTWMAKRGEKNPRRVMIVSQDPLRTNHKAGSLVLSTPFGFHSADYRAIRCENQVLFCFVERLLEECHACVYLTDCRKFFTDDVLEGSRGKANFVRSHQRQYRAMFKSVLDAEMAAFDPDLVVTLGNDAAQYVGVEPPRNGFEIQKIGGRRVIAAYHTGAYASVLRRFVASDGVKTYFDKVFSAVCDSLR